MLVYVGLSSKTDTPAGLRLPGLSDHFVVSMAFLLGDHRKRFLAWPIGPFKYIQLDPIALRVGK